MAHAQSTDTYPAIIVGSGYGGSIAAYNLSRRNIPNLVLERGRWWKVEQTDVNATFPTAATALNPKDNDPNTQNGDARVSWRRPVCGGNLYTTFPPGPDNCTPTTGLLELVNAGPAAGGSIGDAAPKITATGIAALTAAAVGGGSVVNNGVTFAPTKLTWDVAYPPADLPHMQQVWNDLDNKYFKRALNRLGASAPPADVLASAYYQGTTTMYGFFGQLGYPELDKKNAASENNHRSYAPVIVDWDAVRDEIEGVRVPSVINGEAWWGINSGAKKSLDTSEAYLGRAVATGNTEVRPLHTVSQILYDATNKLYSVTVVHTDEAYNTLETLTFKTPNLIMAAGSLGTTKLLVRAKAKGALPNLNSYVGTRFSNNGNTGGFAFVKSATGPANELKQGGPAGVKILDTSVPGQPVALENLPQPRPAFFQAVPQLQPFYGAVEIVGIGVPSQTGTFTYNASTDTVELNWPAGAAHNVYQRFYDIWSKFPGFFVPGTGAPVFTEAQATAFTLHPLGGVPLGLATDMKCGLQGYDGLYAVDGSIVPGSAAVANPSGLIAALSERCMKEMSNDIRKRAKDARKAGLITKKGDALDKSVEVEDITDW
ncbi:MAG TPA: GMC family oxidoreductase N-terminal domain-containing protein [Polyangiales bacterium]|nr:GMC family oxidoreductase N-terminal domain-containing protein [Polyangiales bacterium]